MPSPRHINRRKPGHQWTAAERKAASDRAKARIAAQATAQEVKRERDTAAAILDAATCGWGQAWRA